MTSLNIQKIVIFSIAPFRFGIEAAQIQEIQTFAANRIVREFDDGGLLIRLHSSQAILPVFHLRRCLGLPPMPQQASSSPMTCLIFRWQRQFAGCLIEKVEQVISVQLSALHPVPRLLTHLAKTGHVWGFYAYADLLFPLLDLEQIVSSSAIQETLYRCTSFQ